MRDFANAGNDAKKWTKSLLGCKLSPNFSILVDYGG